MQPRSDEAHPGWVADLVQRLSQARATNLAFPVAVDYDYRALAPLMHELLNNVGDPLVDPVGDNHTKVQERQLIDFLGDLFRAPADDRWGYVTSGGTEGNIYGLYLGRSAHPNAVVYYSQTAHYSIPKAAHMLGMQSAVVATDDRGEIDYRDLHRLLHTHRKRPAVIVANIGTTMTEAVDDVGEILTAIRNVGIKGHYIHSDAALAGIPLALTTQRPRFDLADGADSISVSGHKFIGSPFPSGVVITRRTSRDLIMRDGTYTGSPDTTITGSRSGHAPLLLWHAIQTHGIEGLRQRADRSRELAAYAAGRLQAIGWDAWRHPHAFTVVLRTPPETVTKTWTLAATGEWSHLICMPGITREQIDQFVADMTVSIHTLAVR